MGEQDRFECQFPRHIDYQHSIAGNETGGEQHAEVALGHNLHGR